MGHYLSQWSAWTQDIRISDGWFDHRIKIWRREEIYAAMRSHAQPRFPGACRCWHWFGFWCCWMDVKALTTSRSRRGLRFMLVGDFRKWEEATKDLLRCRKWNRRKAVESREETKLFGGTTERPKRLQKKRWGASWAARVLRGSLRVIST